MKNSKITGKKSAFLALAAAATLSVVSASASAQNATIQYGQQIYNTRNGCVRVYLGGTSHDIAPHSGFTFAAQSGTSYMASVYQYGCGGKALWNSWFQGSYPAKMWWI
ncbi:MAG TPA: hypothetical protein VN089_02035 [Duganella sp.]|nr:hypothetical protein [Duganella sp.]